MKLSDTPKPPRDAHRGQRNWYWVVNRDPNELEWVRASSFDGHDLPRPIVVVNGAFDMLHSGHMKVICHAREKAATLVCAMDSDRRIREAKGEARPILTWIERATALSYMPIDFLVEIDSDDEMRGLLHRLRPDLRVQGAEYMPQATKYPYIRKLYAQATGLRTSEIIRRIRERYPNEPTN